MNPLFSALSFQVGNNTVYDLLLSLVVFTCVLLIAWLFKLLIVGRLKVISNHTKNSIDNRIANVLGNTSTALYFAIALFTAIQVLEVPAQVYDVMRAILLIVAVYEAVKILQRIIEFLITRKFINVNSFSERRIVLIIRPVIGIILWLIALVLILSNLGINVSSLVASLGIGGAAIALASQRILGDVFSSFSIYVDQPFREGDFIVTGTHSGTVRRIGLKSTRIEALSGEEIIIPNAELTNARVQNFKRMHKRRVEFLLPLKSTNLADKLERIPALIEAIIKDLPDVTFERVTFKNILGPRIEFEVVYHIGTGDYQTHTKLQQTINMEILKMCQAEGIEFAP